eukprot:jgi/Chlat1/776/Chrsp104S01305
MFCSPSPTVRYSIVRQGLISTVRPDLTDIIMHVPPAAVVAAEGTGPGQARLEPGRTMPLRQPDSRFDSIWSSVDLITAAARLRHQLLDVALTLPSLLEDGLELTAALHRYEAYWLPLLASVSTKPTTIAPPVDVQWVWQCHMLSPTIYVSDMQHAFNRVLDHALLEGGERLHAQQRGRAAWENRYPGVPFEQQLDGSNASSVAAKFVALPHYADTQVFLPAAVQRYRQFCYLHAMNPNACLAPSYDIDLVWHAHMLHPVLYTLETAKWAGKVFKHDDTLNDRTPGSQLSHAATAARKLWAEWFTDVYEANGSMLRGNPATTIGSNGPRKQYTQDLVAAVSAIAVTVEKPAFQWTGLKCRLALPSTTHQYNPRNHKILTPAVPDWVESMGSVNRVGWRKWGKTVKWTFVINTLLHTGLHNAMHVSFGTHVRLPSLSVRDLLSGAAAWPYRMAVSTSAGEYRVTAAPSMGDKTALATSDNATGNLQGTSCGLLLKVRTGEFAPCNLQDIFAVKQNSAQTVTMPCGQLALATPTSGHAATHFVCDFQGKKLFIVQVSYDASTTMGCCPAPPLHGPRACVIVKSVKSREVEATAHMSGPYELPTPQQVDANLVTVTLDEANGERAMIIRGRGGDWGVCKATWVGKQRGVPGTRHPRPGVPGKPGIPGSFQLQAFRLQKAGSEAEVLLKPQHFASAIDIPNCIRIDLALGHLNIADCDAVPELVAFAFGVGVLRLISARVAVAKELNLQEIEEYRQNVRKQQPHRRKRPLDTRDMEKKQVFLAAVGAGRKPAPYAKATAMPYSASSSNSIVVVVAAEVDVEEVEADAVEVHMEVEEADVEVVEVEGDVEVEEEGDVEEEGEAVRSWQSFGFIQCMQGLE